VARATDQDVADGIVDKQGIFQTSLPGSGFFTPESVNAFRAIRLAATDRTATFDLAVRPGASRTIRVVDAVGQPVPGAAAVGVRPRGITRPPTTAEFTATGLDPDRPRWVLFFHAERKLSAATTIAAKGSEPVTVKLEPLGAIAGRLVNKDGTPAAGRRITFFIQNQDVSNFGELRRREEPLVFSDADGRFRLDDVPHGVPIGVGATRRGDFRLTHLKEQVRVKPGEVLDVGTLKANE
jgi:hypothetical protein